MQGLCAPILVHAACPRSSHRENALLHERLQVMGLRHSSGGKGGGGGVEGGDGGGGGRGIRTTARGHPPPASSTVPAHTCPVTPSQLRQQGSVGRAQGSPNISPACNPSTRPGSHNISATHSTDGGQSIIRRQGSGRCLAKEQGRRSQPCTESHDQHTGSAGQQRGASGGGAGVGVGVGIAQGRRLQRALSAGQAVQLQLQGSSVAAEGGVPLPSVPPSPSAFVGGQGFTGGQGGAGRGYGYMAAAPLQHGPLLSQVHFAVTSRALASGVRLSTTGESLGNLQFPVRAAFCKCASGKMGSEGGVLGR